MDAGRYFDDNQAEKKAFQDKKKTKWATTDVKNLSGRPAPFTLNVATFAQNIKERKGRASGTSRPGHTQNVLTNVLKRIDDEDPRPKNAKSRTRRLLTVFR